MMALKMSILDWQLEENGTKQVSVSAAKVLVVTRDAVKERLPLWQSV